MNRIAYFLRHFFIPSEQNDFRAHSVQVNMLSVYLFVAVMMVFVNKQTGFFSNVLGVATDITTNKLLEYTNLERQKAGLSPLVVNTKLTEAAQKKATNMIQNDYWAHFGPHGESPWDFIKQSGYQYEYAGENLAKNFLFSQNVVDAWMNSPTHRENLLRKDYSEVGFAVINGMLGGEETTLVVQMFGSPVAQAVADTAPVAPQEKSVPVVQTAPPKVLGQENTAQNRVGAKPSTRAFAYNINLIFIAFIVMAIALDMIFAAKLDILHVRSKHVAHLIFVGFIGLGLLFVLKQGAIL
jgi:uncharacterized protein YkwD